MPKNVIDNISPVLSRLLDIPIKITGNVVGDHCALFKPLNDISAIAISQYGKFANTMPYNKIPYISGSWVVTELYNEVLQSDKTIDGYNEKPFYLYIPSTVNNISYLDKVCVYSGKYNQRTFYVRQVLTRYLREDCNIFYRVELSIMDSPVIPLCNPYAFIIGDSNIRIGQKDFYINGIDNPDIK